MIDGVDERHEHVRRVAVSVAVALVLSKAVAERVTTANRRPSTLGAVRKVALHPHRERTRQ